MKINRKTVVILHYHPLDAYPPVLNLLNCLHGEKNIQIYCITTKKSSSTKQDGINKIVEFGLGIYGKGLFLNGLNYFCFYFFSVIFLFLKLPKKILYFESISSFPVLVYQFFLRKKVKVFVHYHEYVTKNEYASGMKIIRYVHKLEKKCYSSFYWISQTNEERLEKFTKDNNLEDFKSKNPICFRVFPNYPPVGWGKQKISRDSKVLKLVYVGYSLDYGNMFAKELFEWVLAKEGQIVLDCYLVKENKQVEEFLKRIKPSNIQIKGKINYFDLPLVLRDYDVGLILYKGHIENYIYNAPNKLFEYLACGLDVWFPKEMLGCYPYITTEEYPKVVKLDFNNLKEEMVERLISKDGLTKKTNTFNCEQVILPLKDELLRF